MHLKKFVAAVSLLGSLVALPAFAQGMMGGFFRQDADQAAVTETAKDEAAGKAVWERLQSKQSTCADLTDDNFDVLGDYYMGLMMGSRHAAMNESLKARLGENGERQMHINLGKRMSGCNAAAGDATQDNESYSMMGWGGGMMGWSNVGWSAAPYGMMGWSYGGWSWWGVLAHVVTVGLVWALLILGIVALWKWLAKQKK